MTPQTAFIGGVLNTHYGYAGGVPDANATANFFVFKAGAALTAVSFDEGGGNVTGWHLHDGTGLVFGPIITPDTNQPYSTWTVTPGNIYVLEVQLNGAGQY